MELIVKVISYDKKNNTCKAIVKNMNNQAVIFDPFVSLAIHMTDYEYSHDDGWSVVGKTYCVTTYTYYGRNNELVPDEYGMKEIY